MKKILSLCIISFLMIGCKKNEPNDLSNFTPRLKTCMVNYLFFQDDISFAEYNDLAYLPGESLYCSYYYHQEDVNKVVGGFMPIPTGTNLTSYIFINSRVYDSIQIGNNTFQIYTKYINDSGQINEKHYNPTVYHFDNQNKLIKVTRINSLFPDGYDLKYYYSENQIRESFNDNFTTRTFYFQNSNLVKIVSEHYDNHGVLFSVKEILFQDYDDKPNPFKNKNYLLGAFFRSFSENNYQGYTINKYYRSEDSTMVLNSTVHVSTPLTYNSYGYPNFGEYE